MSFSVDKKTHPNLAPSRRPPKNLGPSAMRSSVQAWCHHSWDEGKRGTAAKSVILISHISMWLEEVVYEMLFTQALHVPEVWWWWWMGPCVCVCVWGGLGFGAPMQAATICTALVSAATPSRTDLLRSRTSREPSHGHRAPMCSARFCQNNTRYTTSEPQCVLVPGRCVVMSFLLWQKEVFFFFL